jgi:hypothetical protein
MYTDCGHAKYRLLLSDNNGTWILLTDFQNVSNLMKIRLVGAERTDRRTDMTKETAAFRSFANAPKNYEKQKGSGFIKPECSQFDCNELWTDRGAEQRWAKCGPHTWPFHTCNEAQDIISKTQAKDMVSPFVRFLYWHGVGWSKYRPKHAAYM